MRLPQEDVQGRPVVAIRLFVPWAARIGDQVVVVIDDGLELVGEAQLRILDALEHHALAPFVDDGQLTLRPGLVQPQAIGQQDLDSV